LFSPFVIDARYGIGLMLGDVEFEGGNLDRGLFSFEIG
jgi:hypothetical protein